MALLVLGCLGESARADLPKPVLASEATSTRAIAIEPTGLGTQPFAPTTPSYFYGTDQRTRIMLFVMNLSLQPGEDLSAVTAEAEDGTHRRYELKVESLRPVPGQEWLGQLTLRLNDQIGDVGDVRIGIVYRGIASNRVLVGIGHFGDGLPDDTGAVPTPATTQFNIKGQIIENNKGLPNVTVSISDGVTTKTVTTNESGIYTIALQPYANYTFTPLARFFNIVPQSLVFDFLSANQNTANFTATRRLHTVSGQVRDDQGQALDGVSVTLQSNSPGSLPRVVNTSSSGGFSFPEVPAGFSYTLTPAGSNIFTFAMQETGLLETNLSLTFNATRRKYAVSGQVHDDQGHALDAVAVTLQSSAPGSQPRIVNTSNGGFFSFTDVLAGFSYTVTPQNNHNIFAFTTHDTGMLEANQSVTFNATRRKYTISGQVRDDQSNVLDGVSVTLQSNAPGSLPSVINTSSGGFYSFADVPAGFSYNVAPSNSNILGFATQDTGVLDKNLSLTFDATRRKYTVSGFVKQGDEGLVGVPLTLTRGNNQSSLTTNTDSAGHFTFTDVLAGYDYTLSSISPYYALTQQGFQNLSGNLSLSLTGTIRAYTVKGVIAEDGSNAPLSGSIVLLYTGNLSVSRSAVADSDGRYEFTNVPAAYSYTIGTASTATHSFATQTINGLPADLTLDFKGVRRFYTIRGVLTDRANQAIGGVSVMLSGAANSSTVTDASGQYSFSNLPAGFGYNLIVNKTDYIFEPPTRSIYLLKDEQADFVAIRTYKINGRVMDASGSGIAGTTMTLSGAETGKALTTSDGSYSFVVTTVGNYLLTPTKEQNYYAFAPASQSFNNLSAHQTANFTATFSPGSNPSYVLEFSGSPATVDYGLFWPEGLSLGHFFWEFWAMPDEDSHTRYLVSDGYGGAHALLFGFHYGNGNRYNLYGNIWDGTKANFFFSDEGPAAGEWGHFAVGWDGQSLITYYNGVPVGKQPFTGPRISAGRSWGASLLLIGGSDHQNLRGRIAQVRGYEDNNPRASAPEVTFAPQTLFSTEGQFLSYYFRPAQAVADLSSGYNGGTHTGTLRGIDFGYTIACPDCPKPKFVIDPTAPNFSNPGSPSQISAPVDGPPSTPQGALVFDSFSRNNSTFILGGMGGLGQTEGGTLGPQIWKTSYNLSQAQPLGILGGHAVLLRNETAVAWVSTGAGAGNLDVRVDRTRGQNGSGGNTGLSFRVVNKDNYFFAYTSDDESNPTGPKLLSLGYSQAGLGTLLVSNVALPASAWKTLRVVTSQTGSIIVYADNAQVYTTNNLTFATATGAGLFNHAPGLALTNRWDNFTIFGTP